MKDQYYCLPAVIGSVANGDLQRQPTMLEEAHGRAARFSLNEVARSQDSFEPPSSVVMENDLINNSFEPHDLAAKIETNQQQCLGLIA